MATLYVGTSDGYATLQEAIEAAQNGDTIVLKENVTSTESISIVDKNITVDLGGFTLDAQVYIKNASDVEFKNGSMTYTNTNPSFGSAVITTGVYTDEKGDTFSSGGAAALTLTGVNIYGGEAVDSRNYTHAVYYKSTGGLTITDCTVTGGTATRTENSTISRTENNTAHGIYASGCDGDIVIKNSTISGGYGNSEGETRINAGHPVGGGDAIYLSGKSNVTIEDSTVSGGSSKWYNANAGINVTNQFSGTLTVVDSTVTGGTAEGKNPSSSTSGIGGVGIYTNMSTGCKEITITGSAISGGAGGMSWNGSGIEYRNANIQLTITDSTVEAGNGENASSTGSVGALMIANSTSTQIVLDDVKLNGEGNGNAVIKGGDKGVTFVGPVEVVGGTLENVKVSVDATGFEGTQAIISGNVGESVEVTLSGNENAVLIEEGGKTYITTETDPANADKSVIYVNPAWADAAENQLVGIGKFFGFNAFDSFVTALDEITADTTAIEVAGDVTEDIPAEYKEIILAQALEIKGEGTVTLNNGGYKILVFAGADVKVSGVELVAPKTQVFFGISATADEAAVTTNVEVAADALVSAYVIKIAEGSTVDVLEGGKFFTTGEVMRIEGTLNASGNAEFDAASETLTADDRQTVAHYSWIYGTENLKDNYNTIYSQLRLIGADAELNLDNARLEVGKTVAGEWFGNPVANGVGWIKLDGAMTLDNGSVLLASGATGKDGYGLTLSKGADFTVANGSEAELSAGISNMGTVNVDGGTLTAGTNFAGTGTQAPNYDVTNSGDIIVSGGGSFEANNVSNVALLTINGFTKGAARDVVVAFTPVGSDDGKTLTLSIGANQTSLNVAIDAIADGNYNLTIIDGTSVKTISNVDVVNGTIAVNGGSFTADSVSTGMGALTVSGDSTLNIADLAGVANVKGGTLTDSVIGGVVAVTGDTTFEGTNEFSKIWVSGGTLTVDGDLVTKSPYPAFFVIGNDEKVNATEKGFYNGFIGTEAGEMIVNGSYTAEEGVVGNGGKLTVNGEMTTNCLYLRGGDTTVAEGGSLTGIVWGGVDAGATLVVDGGTFGTKKADGMGSFSNAGTFTVKGSSTLDIVDFASGTLTVEDATTLTNSTVAGAGVVQFAENSITTFEGENKITAALDNSVAGFDFVVNEGASLLITRYTLGYGRDITVKGTIEDATALETLDGVTLSLKADSASGFSIGGWGTSILDVKNAYVDLGKSTWKNATGTYTWSFTNSYVTVGCFGNTTAGSSADASWESTFKDSVLVSDTYLKTGKGMEVNFTEGSVATIKGSMRIDGVLNIDDTSSVSVNGYFNAGAAGAASEHSDILGTVNVAGTMNIKGTGPVELLGGSVNVQNGGTLNLVNDNDTRLDVLVDADSELNINGNFTAGTITNNGEFAISGESTVDVALIKGNDVTVSGTLKDSNITFETFDWETGNAIVDGELIVDGGTFKNVQFRADEGEKIILNGDIIAAEATQFKAVNGEIVVNGTFTSDASEASSIELEGDDSTLTINEGSYTKITGGFYLNGGTTVINGELTADADKKALVRTDADVDTAYATWGSTYAAEVTLNDAYVWNAMISINNADTEIIVDNSRLTGWMSFDVSGGTLTATNGSFIEHQAGEGWTRGSIGADAAIVLTEGSTFDAAKTNLTFAGSITLDATSSFIANTLTGEGTITIDAAGFTEGINKVIDLNETASLEGKVTINGLEEGTAVYYLADGDVILSNADMSVLYVGSQYDVEFGTEVAEGKFAGINAFATLKEAIAAKTSATEEFVVESDIDGDEIASLGGLKITTNVEGGVTINNTYDNWVYVSGNANIGAGVTINSGYYFYYGEGNEISGKLVASGQNYQRYDDVITINPGGLISCLGEAFIIRYNNENGSEGGFRVIGDATEGAALADRTVQLNGSYYSFYSGTIDASDTLITGGAIWMTNATDGQGYKAVAKLDNTIWTSTGNLKMSGDATITLDNGSILQVSNFDGYGASSLDATSVLNVNDSTFIAQSLVNNGKITVSGESNLDFGAYSGSGWVYMMDAKLGPDFELSGANVRFADGESTLDGATINGPAFQVGFGGYHAKDERENVADIVVNVTNNSYIHTADIDYNGWVGTGWFESDADKAAAMTDARYTLNIENSVAEFGYFHVSTDGILNVTGNADEKKTYTGVSYSYYGGRTMINGVATFDNVDALVLYTNVSCDNGTETPGKLVIKNGANYVSYLDSSSDTASFKISKTGIVEVDNATLDARHGTLLDTADATLTIKNNGVFKGNVVTNNGTITIDGSLFTAATVTNAGTFTVTGESTVQIETLSGTYIKFTNAELIGNSNIGGNARTYEEFVLAGTLTVKQTNFYGKTTVKDGAVLNGSTTIVSGGSDFTLENGGEINSRFFNVVGTANIAGEINLAHSDPRQKLLQLHDGGVATIAETAVITIDGHNAIVNAGGTLNVNGTLNITKWAGANNEAPERGGNLYNEGTVVLSEKAKVTMTTYTSENGIFEINVTDGWRGVATVVDAVAGTFSTDDITINAADAAAGLSYRIDEATGDLVIYNVETDTVYVDDDWAGTASGTDLGDGKFFGYNAFASLQDVVISDESTKLMIAGGTYSSEFNTTTDVSVIGGSISEVKADGDVVVNVGSLVFETDFAGVVSVNGNFTTTDTNTWNYEHNMMPYYNGAIQFKGGEDTEFQLKGIFNAAEGFTFNAGKIVISEDSEIIVNDQNCGQINVYGDVMNYGAMTVDLQKGSTLRLVNIGNGGSLTLSGEKASLKTNIVNDVPWAGAQCVDFYIANGSLTVKDGAVVEATGIVDLYADGSLTVDNASFTAETFKNNGALTVSGASFLNVGAVSGNGTVTFDAATLTESALGKGNDVYIKGNNTFSGSFGAKFAYVGDWYNGEYTGSIDFGTASSVDVSTQMIIGYDSTVAGANQVVFGDVTGAVKTDGIFKAADVSVRRDGTLTIANTTGENKINTMNVMGEVVIDNAKLSGEVQIGNNSDDIDAVMTVQNGAEVILGGSSNSVVILGKSTSGTMNVDNATVTVKRAGAGAGYNVPADTFVIGYNGGVGELNLTNGANFILSDYNGDQDGGKMNLLLNGGSTITADNSTIDVAGNFENASSLELSNGASATVGSMTLSSALRITGLDAGDKRTITVAIIKKGETKGTSIQIDVEKNSTSAEAYLTDYAGGDYDITVIDPANPESFQGEATIVNGMVKVDGASFTAGTLNICNGAFDVTGESTLKINSVPGETAAVKFIDGTLTDSDVQGTVNAYGETVFRGTNNIKVLATGRDSNYTDVTTTQILGNFTTTNMLTGTVNADSKVYIGAADEERTTAYFGQLGGFGKVAVENADVTYGYAFIRNNFDVKNSTLASTSVNTYFAGNAKVVVDNSTWATGAFTAVGSYGRYMYGNADVTIQNGSTLSAGNFDIEKGGDYIVKVTVDNAALKASSRITLDAGTSLTLLNGAVAETSLVTNNGTVTVNGGTFSVETFTNAGTLTVTSSVFNADSISNAGTITITAVENEKLLTFGALSNTGSIAIDGTGISGAMVKLLDYTGSADMTLEAYGKVILSNAEDYTMQVIDNDLYAVTGSFVIGDIAVNSAWSGEQGEEVAEGRYMGINAFNSIDTIPASGLDKVTIIDSEFEVSNNTFTDPSIEIVLENSKLTGSLTLTGARLVVDEKSSTSVTMTVENGIHICGGGLIDNAVSGDGIATLENITVKGIDGFSQINATDVINDGSFSMTTGYDEITINGSVEAVEGIDFKTGEDKLFISEDAKLTTAWIKNEDDLTISIDLGAAYDGSATITVAQDEIFGSAELVINLDVVGAELGTTNMLVEGISAFNGTIVIDGEELALGGIYAGADYEYELVLNDKGLALEQIVPEILQVRSDVDGNGYSDIVLYHTVAGFSGAWLTQKDGSVEWGDLSTSDAELLGIGKMDDTKALFYLDEGSVGYWKLENGLVAGYETVTSVDDATNVIGLGDFNGDGSTDLLLRNDNGMVGAFMSGGTGWTEFQSLGAEWNVAGVGDLNNDGIDDVILHHTIKGFSGAWLINEPTGNSDFASWGNLGNLEGDMKVVGTGDFNGDGYEDVLISDGKWVGAWMVENGNMTGEVKGFSNSLNGVIEQIGDFNSDGIDDLRLRDQDILGYLSISVDGTATWQQLGKDGVGDEWKTKFSAIC